MMFIPFTFEEDSIDVPIFISRQEPRVVFAGGPHGVVVGIRGVLEGACFLDRGSSPDVTDTVRAVPLYFGNAGARAIYFQPYIAQ